MDGRREISPSAFSKPSPWGPTPLVKGRWPKARGDRVRCPRRGRMRGRVSDWVLFPQRVSPLRRGSRGRPKAAPTTFRRSFRFCRRGRRPRRPAFRATARVAPTADFGEWREGHTPGWLLLPLRGNSPSAPPLRQISKRFRSFRRGRSQTGPSPPVCRMGCNIRRDGPMWPPAEAAYCLNPAQPLSQGHAKKAEDHAEDHIAPAQQPPPLLQQGQALQGEGGEGGEAAAHAGFPKEGPA